VVPGCLVGGDHHHCVHPRIDCREPLSPSRRRTATVCERDRSLLGFGLQKNNRENEDMVVSKHLTVMFAVNAWGAIASALLFLTTVFIRPQTGVRVRFAVLSAADLDAVVTGN